MRDDQLLEMLLTNVQQLKKEFASLKENVTIDEISHKITLNVYKLHNEVIAAKEQLINLQQQKLDNADFYNKVVHLHQNLNDIKVNIRLMKQTLSK